MTSETGRRSASSGIQVVDVAPLVSGDQSTESAAAMLQACQEAGFVYVRNHGIPARVIADARTAAWAFFALPDAAKRTVQVSPHHRGWLASGGARMADDVPADRKESFVWGDHYDAAEDAADHSLRGPNQWPAHPPDLERHAAAWFDHAQRLARCLLRGLAIALDVDGDQFLRHSNRPLSRGSFVYYPQHPDPAPAAAFGVGPHTDFGVLTVLCQDHVGGLEVHNAGGRWLPAPPIDGTLVVNVGDLLSRWTNGVLRSAKHRVICPASSDRLSLVLAFDPNPETRIDASEVCPGTGTAARTVTCGEYLDQRFARAFAYRQPSPHGRDRHEPGV